LDKYTLNFDPLATIIHATFSASVPIRLLRPPIKNDKNFFDVQKHLASSSHWSTRLTRLVANASCGETREEVFFASLKSKHSVERDEVKHTTAHASDGATILPGELSGVE
jgi:hypothetical protein